MVSHIIPSEDIIPLLEADTRRVAFERVLLCCLFSSVPKKKKKSSMSMIVTNA
ncbi:hypothetical protein RHMOL_Rhmol12G0238100 [Rhododendron molle]|uniref:Uncharacterized protein n=1 Tax=Rhododendron molle TaxID=49168 RepID=A0ACC0LMM5_RHOML|nr:hypothetical protein RHMOL_Rhmol12G0238100 [Rhododendron molle]